LASRSLRFNSIVGRIIFLHVIAVGVICILMPLLLYWLLARDADNLHRSAMREHADMLALNLKQEPDGRWQLQIPKNAAEFYSERDGRYAYAIADEGGRVVLSSLRDHALIFPADTDETSAATLRAPHGDALFSGISESKEINGKTVYIQVAENLRHSDVIIDDIVANFLLHVGWITLPVLIALLIFDILVFRRALWPLTQASKMARRIGPSETSVRLPIERMPSEVLGLVLAVNRALDRLAEGFRAQREFVAEVAHELRTPLAILRTRVDTSKETSISDAVRKDVDRMSHVVNQLLEMAELDTSTMEISDELDLQSVCADVVEYIAPLALRAGKEIALNSGDRPVLIRGSREMLFRALRNLAENAIAHSPKGSTVEIVLYEEGTISVLDQGPGIRDEDLEHIFRRFWRGDRQQNGGIGLGLSIVERIIAAHSGSITVANRPEGGARFTMRLPLASTSRRTSLRSGKAGNGIGDGEPAHR
jgi:signal transduction histidine kinase